MGEILTFTNLIRPVCLPNDEDNVIEKVGKVAGWGLAENSGPRGHELIPRETSTKALNDSYCYTTMPQLSIFSSTRIFCGGPESSKDGSPDLGDSGGGFFVLFNDAWIQFGIISSTLTDAEGRVLPNSFTLYTNVLSFKSWISDTVKKSGGDLTNNNKSSGQKKSVNLRCNYEIVLGTT
jgi:secreted trypsin-like serine protease